MRLDPRDDGTSSDIVPACETTRARITRTELPPRRHPIPAPLVAELVARIDACDPLNAGHSARVAALSTMIGQALGFEPDAIDRLRVGALLHDLGKILLPPTLLHRAGPLNAREMALVRRHPAAGATLLAGYPELHFAIPVVRAHHERFDGLGYPDGISGRQIPIFARIVGAADAFDAMISCRAYREPLTVAEAVDEIQQNAGSQFDPLVAWALVFVAEEGGFRDRWESMASDAVAAAA